MVGLFRSKEKLMIRKLLVPLALVVLFCAAVLAVSLAITQGSARGAAGLPPQLAAPGAPLDQATTNGAYLWSYAAKFVCGVQVPLQPGAGGGVAGEPPFKPANYATDINIHNPSYKEVPIKKKLILLVNTNETASALIVREPQTAAPPATSIITLPLGPDAATMDDCNALYAMAFQHPPTAQITIMSGYLVVLSPLEMDVDVVYTAAEPGDVTVAPVSISQDVLRVTGKRVFVPAGALP
jgi:hypothetical protein